MQQQQNELRCKVQTEAKLLEIRVKEMYKIDETLREKFISVNDFIRDCEEKERIADDKIEIETKVHENIHKEIDKISDDIKVLSEFQVKLQATVEEFQSYEDVIESVVAESPLYKNVKDLIDRCDALSLYTKRKYFSSNNNYYF